MKNHLMGHMPIVEMMWRQPELQPEMMREVGAGWWINAEDVKVGMVVDDGRYQGSFTVAFVDETDKHFMKYRLYDPKFDVFPNPMFKAIRGSSVHIVEGLS